MDPNEFEVHVRAELAELRRLLEIVARLACPVCAPAVVAEVHPEAVTLRALAHGNGKESHPLLAESE